MITQINKSLISKISLSPKLKKNNNTNKRHIIIGPQNTLIMIRLKVVNFIIKNLIYQVLNFLFHNKEQKVKITVIVYFSLVKLKGFD